MVSRFPRVSLASGECHCRQVFLCASFDFCRKTKKKDELKRYNVQKDKNDDFGLLIEGGIGGILIKASGTQRCADLQSLAFEAYLFPENLEN